VFAETGNTRSTSQPWPRRTRRKQT
jgi:hypothetical protein